MQEWENQKENIKPLKRGRSAKFLENLELQKIENCEFINRQKHNEWKKTIKCNPKNLNIWLEYIQWIENTYSSLNKKSGFLDALENCTKALFKMGYNNDERYVNVWLRYSDLCTNPQEIFNFMSVNHIGEHCAIFYIKWSRILVGNGLISDADDVLEKGIEKNAQPFDKIKNEYINFQKKMSEVDLSSTKNEEFVPSVSRINQEDLNYERIVFSTINKMNKQRGRRGNNAGVQPLCLKRRKMKKPDMNFQIHKDLKLKKSMVEFSLKEKSKWKILEKQAPRRKENEPFRRRHLNWGKLITHNNVNSFNNDLSKENNFNVFKDY